jgi:hypothetical protein
MPLSLIRPSVFQRPSQLTQAQGQLLKGLKRFLRNGPQEIERGSYELERRLQSQRGFFNSLYPSARKSSASWDLRIGRAISACRAVFCGVAITAELWSQTQCYFLSAFLGVVDRGQPPGLAFQAR